jgi:hypothetical protein
VRRLLTRGFFLVLVVLALPQWAAAKDPCLDLLARIISGFPKEGISDKVTQTLLAELQSQPERWRRIGFDLVDATRLTNLIERNAVRTYQEMIPLRKLATTHDLREAQDLAKLRVREDALRAHHDEIVKANGITTDLRRRVIPSESPVIRVASDPEGNYYVFDGNGRVESIRTIFGAEHPDLGVDVVVYEINDPETVAEIRRSQQRRRGSAFGQGSGRQEVSQPIDRPVPRPRRTTLLQPEN